jgi:TIR domain
MGVVVCYARRDGALLARAVVDLLKADGIATIWDQEPPATMTTSIPEWIDSQIADNTVVCVITPVYGEQFADATAIQAKLLRQRDPVVRPVIPILDIAHPILVPPVLAGLRVTTVDPVGGTGMRELISRKTIAAAPRPRAARRPNCGN